MVPISLLYDENHIVVLCAHLLEESILFTKDVCSKDTIFEKFGSICQSYI